MPNPKYKWILLSFLVVILPFIVAQTIVTKTSKRGWPCQSDIDKLCSSVRHGSRADKEKCLGQYKSQLSDACKNHREGREKKREALNTACERDAGLFCQGTSGNSQTRCLRGHRDQLSKACADQLSLTPRKTSKLSNPPSCRFDVNTYCSGVKGSDNIRNCLVSNKDKLSAQCAQTMNLKGSRAATTASCNDDIARFCSGLKNNRGQVFRCLQEQQSRLSTGCQTELATLEKLSNPKEDDSKDDEEETTTETETKTDTETEDTGTDGEESE